MADRTFRGVPQERVEVVGGPDRGPAERSTVYDDIEQLLRIHGWCRGRPRSRRGALDLGAAVDAAVGVSEPVPARSSSGAVGGPRLARSARIRRHLRDLAGEPSLAAWNDAVEWPAVVGLLALARVVYPND